MCCIQHCIKMDFDVEEGQPPKDVDYDFAEDALDFETQLMESREVSFIERLPAPLVFGSLIICTGTPSEDIPWFAVNIGCGSEKDPHPDVAFHFNIRMPQRYAVRNTRRNSRWGREETTSFKAFPFELGRRFVVEILVDEKEYMIAVDGEHYCAFSHRIGYGTAAWVQATGVRDATLRVTTAHHYPVTETAILEVPMKIPEVGEQNENIWRPNFMAHLSNSIPEGHQLIIYGRVRGYLHSFSVDLLEACREWPRPNIMLHMSVRARDGPAPAVPTPHLVVLNTWRGGWGTERRSRTGQLIPNTWVRIKIVHSAREWAVFADTKLLGTLEFRSPPEAVKAIRLRGDLFPQDVYLCPVDPEPEVPLAA